MKIFGSNERPFTNQELLAAFGGNRRPEKFDEAAVAFFRDAIGHDDTSSGHVLLAAAAKFPDDETTVPFRMFTEKPMRDGMVLRAKGYDLDPWGPTGMPFLSDHGMTGRIQLGSMANVKKTKTEDGVPAYDGDAKFTTDEKHSDARIIFGLYRSNHMKAGSVAVGFKEVKLREFPKDKKDWVEDDNPDSYWWPPLDIVRSRGQEFSAVSVGRHMEALSKKADADPADFEASLVGIVRDVVGYNGGRKLSASEARLLAADATEFLIREGDLRATDAKRSDVVFVVKKGEGFAATLADARRLASAAGAGSVEEFVEDDRAFRFRQRNPNDFFEETFHVEQCGESVSRVRAVLRPGAGDVALTYQVAYANLSPADFVTLVRAVPEKVMKDFGLNGGVR